MIITPIRKNSSRFRIRWGGVVFLGVTGLFGFIAAPLYIVFHGASAFDWALFAVYSVCTMMAITAGYHRLYAHAAYKAHPALRFALLFFGAGALEQSAFRWASLHRTHHRYVDTERDPYNIKRGFFFAHMGWMMTTKPCVDYENVADMRKSKLVMHQHLNYQAWALVAGVIVPALIGLAAGRLLGAIVLGVGARLFLVHHATFFINSFAHTFGTAEYDADSSGKDNWFGALLTHGEGYHNYHHRFPSDYRNGVRWYHWDPTKWLIGLLSWTSLARELNRTPEASILEARAAAAAKHAMRLRRAAGQTLTAFEGKR